MTTPDRLTSSRDIRGVFDRRLSAGTSLLVVHAGPTSATAARDGAPPSRVAVVAGRRVGNAVLRNRAKRRLRAAMAHVPLPQALDVVVTAKPAVIDAPFTQVVEDLSSALRRVDRKAERA